MALADPKAMFSDQELPAAVLAGSCTRDGTLTEVLFRNDDNEELLLVAAPRSTRRAQRAGLPPQRE